MAYKTVIRLDLNCSKCKKVALKCSKCKVALHSVTKIEGIESVKINIHESTLSVIGDADPVCMIQLLKKKFCCVSLVCHVQWPPPPPPTPPKPESEPEPKSKPESKPEAKPESKPESKPEAPPPPAHESCTPGSCRLKKCCPTCCACPPAHESCTPGSCRLKKCCPTCCACPNKSVIMWPRYHNPLAPDEVWYVWKEDQQESCTIM